MGLLLVVALLSGVVLYAPFMRKLPFATVRRDRSSRLTWLDLHTLLGIVTLIWVLAVGPDDVIALLSHNVRPLSATVRPAGSLLLPTVRPRPALLSRRAD